MKRKINRQLMFLSTMAIVITLLLMAVVFYRLFQAQVMEDLKIYAYALADGGAPDEDRPVDPAAMNTGVSDDAAAAMDTGVSDDRVKVDAEADAADGISDAGAVKSYAYIDRYSHGKENVRATVITPEGAVLYDSNADIGGMDNHAGRPEVAQALREGEGRSVRQSSTMQRSTFYFTILLPDGNVLRVARESHSIWSILYRSLPAIVAAVCAILTLCVLLSHYLTASLVAPIGRLVEDMDHIKDKEIYEELLPFAKTISTQHDAIVRNANMRQEFSANVSHELKTPLTAVSGYAELIENGMATGQDAVRFASEIRRNANRLLMLINDTIRLSELDVQDREIPFEKIDLYEVAKDCVEMLQLRAKEREVDLRLQGGSAMVQGDRQMLEELLYNLCDNAISYNNAGGFVLVSVECVDGKKRLRVEDTGIGIPQESQERVFERFYRVDKSRSKSTGGTGLGLAIVKHIVAVHRAGLTLESEPGEGTTVTVVFEEEKIKDL